MGNPYEDPSRGSEITPPEAEAENAVRAGAETPTPDTGETRAETGAETAEPGEFGPETLVQAEGVIRNELESADASPEDRERGEMVADETREIGGVISSFSKTRVGRAASRVLAGGMIALSLAAFMPAPAEAGSRGHGRRGGASVAEIATAGAVIAGLGVLLGGNRSSRETIRARERVVLEQIRAQNQIEIERIKSETKIRTEEIRRGIGQPGSQPRQEQMPNIPPPPPAPPQERQPPSPPAETGPTTPEPVIDEQ